MSGPTPRLDLSKKNLEELVFGGPDLTEDKTKSTCTLFLHHNKLLRLPQNFAPKFGCLKVLYLNSNSLTEFPVEICKILTLQKLHLEHNKIRSVTKILSIGVDE
jgi:Leucine-rich repeat (LRR) protein